MDPSGDDPSVPGTKNASCWSVHKKVTRKKYSRKLLTLASLLFALLLLLAACGGDEPAAEDPGDADDTGATEEEPEDEPDDTGATEEEPEDEPDDEEDTSEGDESDLAAEYAGETVRLIVGFDPGGGFDTVSRIIASELPQHIPGEPDVIVENMPGGGTVIAANHVYSLPPDGLVIVNIHFERIRDVLIGVPEIEFDPLEFAWIGEAAGERDPRTPYVRSELGIETMEDLRNHPETVYFGAVTPGSGHAVAAELLKAEGWPVEVVYGYDSTADMQLAIRQGDLDGFWSGVSTTLAIAEDDLEAGDITILGAIGSSQWTRERDIPEIEVADLGLSEMGIQVMELLEFSAEHLRVYAMAPGTPPEKLEMMRDAFEATLTDPDVAPQLEDLGLTPGLRQVGDTMEALLATPQDVVDRYIELTEE